MSTNQITPEEQPKRKGLTSPDWEGQPPGWAFQDDEFVNKGGGCGRLSAKLRMNVDETAEK